MKKINTLLFLILFIAPLLSCDELIDALAGEVDLPISFVIDINNLAVPEDLSSDPNNSFRKYGYFDLLSNPDVADAVGTPEQVKKIVFNSVEYQYRNFSGNADAVVSGQLILANNSQSFNTQPVNVAQASLTSMITKESFNLQGAQGVTILLNKDALIAVSYSGTSTENPLIFDTRLIISATVTVEINPNDL
jgi:hypothetical protein